MGFHTYPYRSYQIKTFLQLQITSKGAIVKKIKLLILLSTILLSITKLSAGTLEVDAITLKTITPQNIIYTGKVEPFESVLLAFNVPGIINMTLPLGTQVYSTIASNSGKIIRPGTIVASLYKNQQAYAVKAAELAVAIAQSNYDNAQLDYKRQKELIAKNAVALRDYQNANNTLLNTKLTLETAVNALVTAKYNFMCTDITAPFDGIVSEVIRGPNRGVGNGDDILQITRLNPIMIKISFPNVIKELISQNTLLKVYSNRMTTPSPAWYEPNPKDTLNAEFFVGNKIIPTNITPAEEKLPKVYEVLPVTDMGLIPNPDLNKYKLAIPKASIRHDKNGQFYVLRAKGQKALSLEKGISKTFKVERVNIVPGDVNAQFNLGFKGEVNLCNLKDPGSLKFHDVLIVDGDKGIIDGDKVVLVVQHFMFLPNELVAVHIPSLCKPGFYVHNKAIILMGKGKDFVYINDNGKAKLVNVKVTGTTGRYYKIEAPEIKEGVQVLYFDKLSELRSCYDGIPIKIEKIINPPIHLEKPRAAVLRFPVQPVEEIYHL